jgi:peroxiredoxin
MKTALTKVFILLAACAVMLSCGRPAGSAGITDFTIKSVDGTDYTLSQNKEKVILLVFGASWCPYCRNEIPELNKLYAAYQGKPFEVVYVNLSENESHVKNFVKEKGIKYLTLVDESGQTARSYGVFGIPANFLIDKSQTTITDTNLKDIKKKIDELLKK